MHISRIQNYRSMDLNTKTKVYYLRYTILTKCTDIWKLPSSCWAEIENIRIILLIVQFQIWHHKLLFSFDFSFLIYGPCIIQNFEMLCLGYFRLTQQGSVFAISSTLKGFSMPLPILPYIKTFFTCYFQNSVAFGCLTLTVSSDV